MNEEKKKKTLATGVGLASGAVSGTAVGIIRNQAEPLEATEVNVQQVAVTNEQPVIEVEANELEQIQTPQQDIEVDAPTEIQPVENIVQEGEEEENINTPVEPTNPVDPNEPLEPIDDIYGGPVDIVDDVPDMMYGGPEDIDNEIPVVMYGGPEDYDDEDPGLMYGGPEDYDDDDPSIDDDDEGQTMEDLIDEVLSEDLLSDDL